MKYSFSKDFETVRYTECLAEIGLLIEQLRKESGCSANTCKGVRESDIGGGK